MKTSVRIFGVSIWIWCLGAVVVSATGVGLISYVTEQKDEEIAKLRRNNTEMRKLLDRTKVEISEVKQIIEAMQHLVPNPDDLRKMRNQIELNQGLNSLEQKAERLLAIEKLKEQSLASKQRSDDLEQARKISMDPNGNVYGAIVKMQVKEAELGLKLAKEIKAARESD